MYRFDLGASKPPRLSRRHTGIAFFFSHTILRPVRARSQCSCELGAYGALEAAALVPARIGEDLMRIRHGPFAQLGGRGQLEHRLGASGSARRSLRSSRTRNSALGTKSGPVGRTVRAQLAPAPIWDSSSARDADSKSAKSTSNTRLSTAAPVLRCHRVVIPFGSPEGGGTQRRARPLAARWAAC